MLKRDIKPGDILTVGESTIRVVKKYGQAVTLVIDAPKHIKILVEEGKEQDLGHKSCISST